MKLSRLSNNSAERECEFVGGWTWVSSVPLRWWSLTICWATSAKALLAGWGKWLLPSIPLHQEWSTFGTEISANKDDCWSATEMAEEWSARLTRSDWRNMVCSAHKEMDQGSNNLQLSNGGRLKIGWRQTILESTQQQQQKRQWSQPETGKFQLCPRKKYFHDETV